MTTNGTWQFHVGQDVVCIDASISGEQYIELTDGGVYRLRWVGLFTHYIYGEYLGVKLEGIERMVCPHFGYPDMPYNASRFRPLVKDRLSSLRSLLAGNGTAPSIDEPTRPVKVKEEEKV